MAVDIGSIRQRVKESGLFTQVRDVVSLADAVRNPGANLQTAFVVIPRETAEPSRTIGAHRQRVTARVAVTFPLQAQTVAMDRSDQVEGIRSTVKSHLSGWTPSGAETALDYSHSEISAISGGFVWVNVFFNCRYIESALMLGDLGVTPAVVAENAAEGTLIGAVTGETAGSTVTLIDDAGGRFVLDGGNLVRGATPLEFDTDPFHELVLREAKVGAVNSPKLSRVIVAVTEFIDPELVTNGRFDSPDGWEITGSGASISDGSLNLVSGTGVKYCRRAANRPDAFVLGGTYLVTFTIVARTQGNITVRIGADETTAYPDGGTTALRNAAGTYVQELTLTSEPLGDQIIVHSNLNAVATIVYVSVLRLS